MKKKILKLTGVFCLIGLVYLNTNVSNSSEQQATFNIISQEANANGENGNCVKCDNVNNNECQKVMVGNEAHYFAGPRSSC